VINNRITPPVDLNYRLIETEHKKNSVPKNYIVVSSKRYFVHPKNFGPASTIMGAGIEEALKGNYLEAETLFNEIKENINDGSVENNLAIIYEITKREREAMAMYVTALMKSPENMEIKNNLLSYINDKKFTQKI
jgi:tetratricopeptide (TPR) repeat protein